jgi:hypothetical protein
LIKRPKYAANPAQEYSSDRVQESFPEKSAASCTQDQRREPQNFHGHPFRPRMFGLKAKVNERRQQADRDDSPN